MGVRVAYTLHPEKPDPANPVAAVDLLPQRQHGVRLGVKHLHVDYSSFVFGRSGQAQFQLDGHIEIFGDRVAIPKLYDYPQHRGKDWSARLLPNIPTTMEPSRNVRVLEGSGISKTRSQQWRRVATLLRLYPQTVIAEAPGDKDVCPLSCERNT